MVLLNWSDRPCCCWLGHDVPAIVAGLGRGRVFVRRVALCGPLCSRYQCEAPWAFVAFYQDERVIINLMEKCRAFVYAGIEDFGIAPVEAMAAGAPIIALKKAGILDTVRCIKSDTKIPTGILFNEQSHKALQDCINYFEEKKLWKEFCSEDINLWSQNFSINRFKKEFTSFVNQSLAEFKY